MAQLDYKTTNEKENDISAIPAGEYTAHIKSSERKETKNGNEMLVLQWEILDGDYRGRIIFENLNLWHPNAQARAISQGAMNSICIAAGFPEGVRDSGQLERKAMILKVGVRDNKEYGPQNIIKKHSPYGNKTNQPNQAQPTPEQNEKETPKPWA